MSNQKLEVRVKPKSAVEAFFRCGMKFGLEWETVDVDDATAGRLREEQMLEVRDVVAASPALELVGAGEGAAPAEPQQGAEEQQAVVMEQVNPDGSAPNEADPSGDQAQAEPDSNATAVVPDGQIAIGAGDGFAVAAPDSPGVRLDAIRAAIGELSPEDAALWTAGGKPKTEAIAAITGWPVTAAERDAAMAEVGGEG